MVIKFGMEGALISCEGNLVLGKFYNISPYTSQRLNLSLSTDLVRVSHDGCH